MKLNKAALARVRASPKDKGPILSKPAPCHSRAYQRRTLSKLRDRALQRCRGYLHTAGEPSRCCSHWPPPQRQQRGTVSLQRPSFGVAACSRHSVGKAAAGHRR